VRNIKGGKIRSRIEGKKRVFSGIRELKEGDDQLSGEVKESVRLVAKGPISALAREGCNGRVLKKGSAGKNADEIYCSRP